MTVRPKFRRPEGSPDFVQAIPAFWYAQRASLPSPGGSQLMFTVRRQTNRFSRFISKLLLIGLLAGPATAQQQTPPKPPPQTAAVTQAPPFEELLSTDTYKMYGEVRNVGQLLSNGGAGEIVDPILKLADPGPPFNSIVSFLKKNSEVLAQSRLMFASWPVRTDVPTFFVAIEFPTNEDAAKFAPKLETFLPTVLPPVPAPPNVEPEVKPSDTGKQAEKSDKPNARPSPQTQPAQETPKLRNPRTEAISPPPEERLPFIITHTGNLVCITEKAFRFSKLRPKDSRPLFYDQNFRMARDQFSSEPIFFFFNVALEDKTKPSPTPFITDEEAARLKAQEVSDAEALQAVTAATPVTETSPDPVQIDEKQTPVLIAETNVSPSPMPTPTKAEQAQRIAGNQIGQMLDSIGFGEPQWPEAVGLAVALEGNEYIVRAVMIDKPEAKKTPIPFVPQLIGGPAFTSDAASVLPDDTDVMVSASVDLTQTFDGMRKAEEKKHKADSSPRSRTYENGVLVTEGRPRNESPDVFATFEKNAGLKIKDDLLPAFGNEIAIAGSLKTLNAMGMNVVGMPGMATATLEVDKDGKAKKESALPTLLIEVKNRDAARPLMPKILSGLGIGEANLLAQTEKHGDTEMVNYAGIFAYAFVGDFVVISDALGVRKVVDAYINHTTLSSNNVFRNSRRWQPSRTTGQIYVSPAMMEASQADIRKRAPTMDAALRDFLLGLNPNAEAITYALSDDGMGTRHELRLPKNYILLTVASISSATKNPPPEANEMIAISMLQYLTNAESQYKQGAGKGSYGSMDKLIEAKLFPEKVTNEYGYTFQVTVMGDSFEGVATPREYGKSGKRSFFVDKSGVVRGDDHGGGPATIADKPVQP
jgi:hypothetical protein